MSEEKNPKKEIEVVNGDGKDLTISPVYEHIKSDDDQINKKNKKQNIVIPKGRSDKEKGDK